MDQEMLKLFSHDQHVVKIHMYICERGNYRYNRKHRINIINGQKPYSYLIHYCSFLI